MSKKQSCLDIKKRPSQKGRKFRGTTLVPDMNQTLKRLTRATAFLITTIVLSKMQLRCGNSKHVGA